MCCDRDRVVQVFLLDHAKDQYNLSELVIIHSNATYLGKGRDSSVPVNNTFLFDLVSA